MNRSFIESRLSVFTSSGVRLQNAIVEAEKVRSNCPKSKLTKFDFALSNAKTSFNNLVKATEITAQSIKVAQDIFGVGLFGMLESLGVDSKFARVGIGSLIEIASRSAEINTRQLMKICAEIQNEREVRNA